MSRPSSSTRPAGRVVQPRHQRRGRGLAAAGRADERIGLAVFEREGDVAQHRLSARRSSNCTWSKASTALLRGRRLRPADCGRFDSSASTSEMRSKLAIASWNDDHTARQLPQRHVEAVDVEQEADQQADREAARRNQHEAVGEHDELRAG